MFSVAARVAKVVAAEVQALSNQQLIGALVGKRGPLELEEQQRRLDRSRALLHELHQRPVGRIGGVTGEAQGGVGARAAHQLLNDGELLHRRAQALGIELDELAGVALGEGLGPLQRLGQAALDALFPLPLDQRFQIPGGLLQLGVGGFGGGLGGHARAQLSRGRPGVRRLLRSAPARPKASLASSAPCTRRPLPSF